MNSRQDKKLIAAFPEKISDFVPPPYSRRSENHRYPFLRSSEAGSAYPPSLAFSTILKVPFLQTRSIPLHKNTCCNKNPVHFALLK